MRKNWGKSDKHSGAQKVSSKMVAMQPCMSVVPWVEKHFAQFSAAIYSTGLFPAHFEIVNGAAE